jgi:hypothetical protein
MNSHFSSIDQGGGKRLPGQAAGEAAVELQPRKNPSL